MTAFARAEKSTDTIQVIVEIRSLNSKNLDLVLRLAPTYFIFEDKIKAMIKKSLNRGRIETMISIHENTETQDRFEADLDRATEYIHVLKQVIDHFQLKHSIGLRDIMKAGNIIKPLEKENDLEAVEPLVLECLKSAIDDICSMRATEGKSLFFDIDHRLNDIVLSLEKIKALASDQLDYYYQKLHERINNLTHNMIDIDPVRISQEAAILADRSDVSEEITRLESHIQQFRNLMNENEPVGRKLNFLLQEIGRELNTVGSKSGSAEISKIIVNLKSEHEKIREQIQNIE
jgi:uncharacterized protein (TIGR00255 family)